MLVALWEQFGAILCYSMSVQMSVVWVKNVKHPYTRPIPFRNGAEITSGQEHGDLHGERGRERRRMNRHKQTAVVINRRRM